jgi:site-specific recombinase XerD
VRHRKTLRTKNKKIAEELRTELTHELLHGEPNANPKRIPMETLVIEYARWSRANKRPKTVLNDQARIRKFRAFANLEYVDQVASKNVMDYFSHRVLEDSVSPTTILREHEILRALMTFAQKRGYVKENPVAAVARPKVPEREPRFLISEQIVKLPRAMDGDRIAPIVATAVYAGLRREELCWLTPADLDMSGTVPLLRVRQKRVNGQEWIPKTRKNARCPCPRSW